MTLVLQKSILRMIQITRVWWRCGYMGRRKDDLKTIMKRKRKDYARGWEHCARGNSKKKWKHLGGWAAKLHIASKKKKKITYKLVKTLRRNLHKATTQFKWQEGRAILLDNLWAEDEISHEIRFPTWPRLAFWVKGAAVFWLAVRASYKAAICGFTFSHLYKVSFYTSALIQLRERKHGQQPENSI